MAHYVGIDDLIHRWKQQADWTPQGARKVMHARDFPAPQFAVNRGKTPVWFLPDVAAFEQTHPELKSAAAKHDKVRGYAIANLKKRHKARTSG